MFRPIAALCSRNYAHASRNLSTVASRLQSVSLPMNEWETMKEYYEDAVGFKPVHTRASANYLHFGDSGGCRLTTMHCTDILKPPVARSPAPTYAVSNLKTAVRQAQRRGGTIVEGPVNHARDVTEATVSDPTGNVMTLLHVFRRNPLISLTLSCKDVEISKHFYEQLGFSHVTDATELRELHLPSDSASRLVMACGPCHLNAALVLESHPSAASSRYPTAVAPVLTVAHPDVNALRSRLAATGKHEIVTISEGSTPMFLTLDPDENPVEVVPI